MNRQTLSQLTFLLLGLLCLVPIFFAEIVGFSGGPLLSEHPAIALLALPAMFFFRRAARNQLTPED